MAKVLKFPQKAAQEAPTINLMEALRKSLANMDKKELDAIKKELDKE